MSEVAFPKAVVGTGLYTMSTYGQHYLSGWYFTETGGTNGLTVVVRKDSDTGTILEDLQISAGKSVGEDYGTPQACIAVHVTITGTGVCQGAVRGR